ncbi:DUF1992 domain-containing protein [Streptomyces sp. NPDC060194]|uniref:DnaJ family domain-containing protein n=1 Tax=Streptomyces sp. NPDC060194 TaxID=3347069 RepID=UPI003657F435
MTERKPPGVDFESWVDKQIRDAEARGEFAAATGRDKPLEGLEKPYDELWWIRQKAAREGLSSLPPTLALRKEAEDFEAALPAVRSESEVRRLVADLNARILPVMLRPPPGPPLGRKPFDVEEVVRTWRAARRPGAAG